MYTRNAPPIRPSKPKRTLDQLCIRALNASARTMIHGIKTRRAMTRTTATRGMAESSEKAMRPPKTMMRPIRIWSPVAW